MVGQVVGRAVAPLLHRLRGRVAELQGHGQRARPLDLGLRRVDVGQYVSPGTPLVTLQQLDPMFIDFPMPEQRLGELKVGQSVEVEVDAYPGETFKGKIGSIDARVSAETRNVLVRGEIDNNEQKLLPNDRGAFRFESPVVH